MRGRGTWGGEWAASKEAYSAERRRTASLASVNSFRSGALPPPPLPPPPVWNNGHLVYSARKACGTPVVCRSTVLLFRPWKHSRCCIVKHSGLPSGIADGSMMGQDSTVF